MDRRSFLFAPLALSVGIHAGPKEPRKFLFIGDSITDGNRGRNDDPNHILGHGFVFSIATRLGRSILRKD